MSTIPNAYSSATKTALTAAAACGPIGAFSSVADIGTIAGIWGTYLCNIAYREHVAMDKTTAVQICKSALLGMAGYYAGCKTASRAFELIPGAGTVIGIGLSALTNVLFTYRFALTVCAIFSEQGTSLKLGELAGNIRSLFRRNGLMRDTKYILSIWMHG